MSQDYLDEDKPIKGQQFACLSMLTPNSFPESQREQYANQSILGLKVRGVYATIEEARTRAQQIQKLDKYHNVFVGEVGKWLPFDSDISKMSESDPVYREQELNKYMKAYKDALSSESQEEKKRKEEMLKGMSVVQKDKVEEVEEEKSVPMPENGVLKEEKPDLGKELDNSKEKLASIEDKLAQMKELAEKLNK